MNRRYSTLAAAGLLAGLRLAPAASVRADAVSDFYKGRDLNWILSAGAGGGYAAYARLFAPHFERHIPGTPKIVIQNMPGAGGIRAMNYLASVAAKDGSVMGLVHSSVPFAPLYGVVGPISIRANSAGSAPWQLLDHVCFLDKVWRDAGEGFVRGWALCRWRHGRGLANGNIAGLAERFAGHEDTHHLGLSRRQ